MCEGRVIQDTTKSGQVVLLLDEIRFLADALRDVGPTIERCSGHLDRLCADQECPDGGDLWAHTIETAGIDDELDKKWDVESENLLCKIRHLSSEVRRKSCSALSSSGSNLRTGGPRRCYTGYWTRSTPEPS